MAAQPSLIPVEEYLRTTSDPDCEYVDGVIEERPVGEYDHSTWQTILAAFFTMRQVELGIEARTELRMRVAQRRFRVPDVTLLSRKAPREQIITHAPLAVFEILSPEDTMARMLEKLADYERMGVAAIWVIEPTKQVYYQFQSGQLTPGEIFALPGTSYTVPFAEIAALAQ
ncbi:MAG: Uma2 family endonuclease [Terracidiphilus sp.]|jgi:Uma2 family endonuclease